MVADVDRKSFEVMTPPVMVEEEDLKLLAVVSPVRVTVVVVAPIVIVEVATLKKVAVWALFWISKRLPFIGVEASRMVRPVVALVNVISGLEELS